MEAMRDIAERGYLSEAEIQEWIERLHAALDAEIPSYDQTREELEKSLEALFNRDLKTIHRRVLGVPKYKIDRVAPQLRAELDRRIFAGADLIKLNREAAIAKTLQRFSGWATSVPPAGKVPPIRDAAKDISKDVSKLSFERRRVAIDQGHKLSAAVASVVATQHGAIAAIWRDRGASDHNYNARPDHLTRSGTVFAIRDSWAMEQGLIKKGGHQYTDEVEMVAELPFCSCFYQYIAQIRDLPDDMLTERGREWLAK